MSTRPRTRLHFPHMKDRARGRRLRRRPGTVTLVVVWDVRSWNEGMTKAAEALAGFAATASKTTENIDLAAAALAHAAESECHECEHVHDVANDACLCCVINSTDPASMRRRSHDLLTLRCMAAEHDHCEGDFCECACHEVVGIA